MKSFLETWKDIEGYEGLYQVSDFGEVRSLGMWTNIHGGFKRFLKGRVLKPSKDRGGYLYVLLYKNGNRKTYKVHRLVAQAFLPNPNNLPEVNHIDENKENNKVCSGMVNLEWCTTKYNLNYGTRNKRSSDARRGVYNNPKKSDIVLQMTLDYVIIKEWASVRECGRNGFDQSTISKCCNNKYGSQGNVYKGYRWIKKEDYDKLFAA